LFEQRPGDEQKSFFCADVLALRARGQYLNQHFITVSRGHCPSNLA
jgi:hypothetical protein